MTELLNLQSLFRNYSAYLITSLDFFYLLISSVLLVLKSDQMN